MALDHAFVADNSMVLEEENEREREKGKRERERRERKRRRVGEIEGGEKERCVCV